MSQRYELNGRTATEIAGSVETAVRSGTVLPGETLPPVRSLAADLDVSPGTVASAYKLLRQRGVVHTAGRHGTKVRGRPPLGARAAKQLPVPPGVTDLAAGGPDPRLLPAFGPRLARIKPDPSGYERAGALPELLDIARERLGGDGVPVTALTVTNGALDGIERLLTGHLVAGDPVAVEDPGWGNLLDLVAALGLHPVPVPVDDSGPLVAGLRAALAAGARAFVVTSRAHNPTGAALTSDRAAQLRDVLRERPDVLVIEDDHAAELSDTPLATLAGATASWGLLRSASKPYGPDLRLAVLAGDEATVDRVAGRMRMGAGWVSTVLQQLVVELWRDPAVAALVRRARDSYAARRDGLVAALTERGVPASGRTGINVWVPVADETATVARLRDAGWAVSPGAIYRLASPPAVRVTISLLDPADLAPLADALASAQRPLPARYGA